MAGSFENPAAHHTFPEPIQENSNGTLGSQNVLVQKKINFYNLQKKKTNIFLFLAGSPWK